ncbi:hypothetical protein HF521_016154 [Silurus meridionalis]|uniref:trypsin n=1 Tax=Silurus meridionalis TaxID=175797 RepID=A0A8T0BQL4_SILME|nr:hypothetical protein HF521_016154 [Silurus meridionalis]
MFLSISIFLFFVLPLCGGMESGIIGGKEAKPHSRPYIVSVQIDKHHKCGGLLIRKDYVLTAAHCFDNIEYSGKKQLEVVLGAHNISRKEHQQQRIEVQKYIMHPCYRKNERPNDIMLLKLKSNAKLNKAVKVIALPEEDESIPANQLCLIAGWGKTAQNSAESSVLKEATLKVQFNFECRNIWKDRFLADSMICTVSDGKKAFCQGDSGSPLICGNEPIGIAAYTFGGNCLNRKFPEERKSMLLSSVFVWWSTDMLFTISLVVLSVIHSCGGMESSIIGGKVAIPHSRPYMVSVQNDKKHKCGGLLIRKNYVLTAAHCADNIEYSGKGQLEVVLGAHNISKKEHEQQRIKVKKCIKHPCYRKDERANDIMLLKLKSNAKLNKNVTVIALPKEDKDIPANRLCSIAGWGKTAQNSAASNVLKEVTLKIMSNSECKDAWQMYFDSYNMICTNVDGKNAFCQGDSGSPLICDNQPQGIAAYTFSGNCLNDKYPEVYMKISSFLPWIKQVIG